MAGLSYEIKEVDGIQYAEAGADSKATPVLLLHGMMGTIDNWDNLIPAVADAGYRIVCPVLPMYTIKLRQAHLQGIVDFVRRFTDLAGMEKAVVTGNSFGGHVAAMYAMQFPERVAGVVLSGASGIYEVEMSSSVMRRNDKNYLRPRVEKTFYDPKHVTDELLDDVIDIITDREKAIRLIKFARAVEKTSIKDELDQIKAPTLLIWGKQDQITPPDVAETFHAGVPSSELHWIDECGHVPMQEQPAEFNRIYLDFLSRVVGEPSRVVAG
ncbi:MAG: alpha/beta fold hydrolase [Rhodothermales bacterium]